MTTATVIAGPILVADDDSSIRWILATIFAKTGHAVHEASNGKEALARILELGKFGTLITDYEMWPMNGCELIDQIVRSKIPYERIVLISGSTEAARELRKVAQIHSHVTFLPKPFSAQELLEHLTAS